jgi:HEAT repeat protein
MEVLPMTLGLVDEPDKFYEALEQLPESLDFKGLRIRILGLTEKISERLLAQIMSDAINFIRRERVDEAFYFSLVFRSFKVATGKVEQRILTDLARLLVDHAANVRRQAIRAIGEIGSVNTLQYLLPCLNDVDETVRHWAISCIGIVGTDEIVRLLSNMLPHADERTKVQIILALGQTGNESAVEILVPLIESSSAEQQRRVEQALGLIQGDKSVRLLLPYLNDPNEYIRWSAMRALGRIGNSLALPDLIALLAKSKTNETTCWQVALTLGRIGGKEVVDPLIELLGDKHALVRQFAAEALGKIRSKQALRALIPLLSETEINVFREVFKALKETPSFGSTR